MRIHKKSSIKVKHDIYETSLKKPAHLIHKERKKKWEEGLPLASSIMKIVNWEEWEGTLRNGCKKEEETCKKNKKIRATNIYKYK